MSGFHLWPHLVDDDLWDAVLTYGVAALLVVLELQPLERLRARVAFWSWSPSAYSTVCYMLLLLYAHSATSMASALRDSSTLPTPVLLWFVVIKARLMDAITRRGFGTTGDGAFARLIAWWLALRLEMSPQLFVIAIVECVRLVLLLVVASSGAPRFVDVPRFVVGAHLIFACVDRLIFYWCWTHNLAYPTFFALQMVDPVALPVLLPLAWLFGSNAAAPIFVGFAARDAYAYARPLAGALSASASQTTSSTRSGSTASPKSGTRAVHQQHLTEIAKKQFPHFNQREVEELVATFSALDLDENGVVDARELSFALGRLADSTEFDVKHAQKLIDDVDIDQNGGLDFFEFLRCISSAQESRLGRIFAQSGMVSFLQSRPLLSREDSSDALSDSGETMLACVACKSRERCIVLEPCMHVPLCAKCNRNLNKKDGAPRFCPVCKARVTVARRVYL